METSTRKPMRRAEQIVLVLVYVASGCITAVALTHAWAHFVRWIA